MREQTPPPGNAGNDTHNEKYLKHFGKLVKAAGKASGKQVNLAKAMGMTQGTLSKIEQGKYPGLKYHTIIALCEYLQIPLSELPPHPIVWKYIYRIFLTGIKYIIFYLFIRISILTFT